MGLKLHIIILHNYVLLVNKPPLTYHRPPLKCVKIHCISSTIQLDRTCGRTHCGTPEISYGLVRTSMLNQLYSLLCFFVSHIHFLILYIHPWSEHHGLSEMSVNVLAKKHEPKDVRRGGSPVLYSDQSFDRFLSDLNPPCQHSRLNLRLLALSRDRCYLRAVITPLSHITWEDLWTAGLGCYYKAHGTQVCLPFNSCNPNMKSYSNSSKNFPSFFFFS